VLRPIVGALKEKREGLIDAVESRIDISQEFSHAQFVSAKNGWAVTPRVLYKTSDGGKTWNRIALNLPPDTHVSSFFFTDEARGWLAVASQVYVKRYALGNSSRIMVTNDGGYSWIQQASFPDEVKVDHLKFLNSNEGLATGAKVIDLQPAYDEIFVASTQDGGRHWNNISEKVKTVIKDQSGIASGFGHDINWSSPDRILLLSKFGRIISSTDKGESWREIVQFKDERPNGLVSSIGYYKVVLDASGRIRVLAGGMGDEGSWGDLIVSEDLKSWASYEVGRVPILDAIFLSDNEVVACGHETNPFDEKTKNRGPSVGIILHSVDGGKNWSAIYRSASNETFVSLTKVSDNNFYAVSDAGTLLRFALRND
jgi:photosystem II stability/assembly factor-like uncharacterized protein